MPALLTATAPPDLEAAAARARELLNQGEPGAAADAVIEVLSKDGSALRGLARDLRRQGRDRTALAIAVSAALLQAGRTHDGVEVLSALPEPPASEPAVRAAIGAALGRLGYTALAVDKYGNPRSLPGPDRRDRRRAWWKSGGPLQFVRRRRLTTERAAFDEAYSQPSTGDRLSLDPPMDLGACRCGGREDAL